MGEWRGRDGGGGFQKQTEKRSPLHVVGGRGGDGWCRGDKEGGGRRGRARVPLHHIAACALQTNTSKRENGKRLLLPHPPHLPDSSPHPIPPHPPSPPLPCPCTPSAHGRVAFCLFFLFFQSSSHGANCGLHTTKINSHKINRPHVLGGKGQCGGGVGAKQPETQGRRGKGWVGGWVGWNGEGWVGGGGVGGYFFSEVENTEQTTGGHTTQDTGGFPHCPPVLAYAR